jgi:hypothetical protein
VQRQHVRNRAAGVLLGQCVVALGQQTFVKRVPNRADPDGMKIVEDAGFNKGPIMYGHGRFS